MKVRKLAVALALAGGLGSGVAQALGLGEIELQSYLNQPLNAEIGVNRLDGVSPDEIVVNLASERDYERVGLRREFFLTQLDFDVTTADNGELVISVTSDEPVREPYLNFLLEVTWPSGRVMREYSLLVDPPVYAEESDDAGQQPVERAQSQQQASEPRSEPRQSEPSSTSEDTASRSSGPRTLGPVQASDTLWEIARSVRPDSSVSMQQVMLAIQDLNQDAFINGNINRLKRGEVLRVPDMDDIRARTQAEANREVTAQNNALAQPEPEVDATETAAADQGGAEGAAGEASPDELRLVVPGDGEEETRSEGSAGGDGRQGGSADAGDAVAMEELDRAERENEELNSRLADLQDQVETLERLIELKDSQLAEMQSNLGEDGEPEESAPQDGSDEASGQDIDDGTADDASVAAADENPSEDGTTEDGVNEDQTTEDVGDGEAPQTDEASADEDGAIGESDDDASATSANDMASEDADGVGDEQAGSEQGADDPAAEDPAAATGTQPESDQAEPATAEREEQDKSFLATAIDLIAGNFMYQIALGGFLVLLLLLVLLISRRRANNENDFYQQLDDETEGDSFELNLGEEEEVPSASVIEEADRYVSYGQHDAAAEVLENAISREPSRSDLRLKLLAVYADTGNRAAFDKQYAELEAMEFDDAQPEAEALRTRLEEVESTPSIDELESQLRGGESQTGGQADDESNDLMAAYDDFDLSEDQPKEAEQGESDADFEYDFTELDTTPPEDVESMEEPPRDQPEDDDGLADIDFELPEEEPRATPEEEGEQPLDLEDDFSSLELDEAGIDSEPSAEDTEGAADPVEEDDLDFGDLDLDSDSEPAPEKQPDRSANPEEETELDESFLDELDAELDKVATEGNDDSDGLDDLELDVSDEDLALMDQASEAQPEPEDESQLDLGDLELDEPEESAGEQGGQPDDLSDLEIPELDSEGDADDPDAPVESAERKGGTAGIDDIDGASLGDDDDFDFLSGTDEVATKLDLARAYVDMGDSEGAREILEEVILEGSDEQKSDAQSLLKKLP